MKKILNILLICIFILEISSTPITDCDSTDTNVTIKPGDTSGVSTWDDIVSCVSNLKALDGTITHLIIDSTIDISSSKNNALDLLNNVKLAPSYFLQIKLANSELNSTDVDRLVYTAVEADIDSIDEFLIIIYVVPLISNLSQIENWMELGKISGESNYLQIHNFNGGAFCGFIDNIYQLKNCFLLELDEDMVKNICDESLKYLYALKLTSSIPSEVNECLAKLNVADSKLDTLTIDYSGVTSVSAENLNFTDLLSNIPAQMRKLHIDLSETNYLKSPVIDDKFVQYYMIYINYSNNGINQDNLFGLLDDIIANITNNEIYLQFSQLGVDNNILGPINIIEDYLYQQLKVTMIVVPQYDRDYLCNYEFSGCEYIEVELIEQNNSNNCMGGTVDLKILISYRDTLIGESFFIVNPYLITKPQFQYWEGPITSISDQYIFSLPTQDLEENSMDVYLAGSSLFINNKKYHFKYKKLDIYVDDCNSSETKILVNGNTYEGINSYIDTQRVSCNDDSSDLIFTFDENMISQQLTEQTSYQWHILIDDDILNQLSYEGLVLDQKTLSIDQTKLAAKNYIVKLQINNPTIIVEKFYLGYTSCDAQILINGNPKTKGQKLRVCEDITLSIDFFADQNLVNMEYYWQIGINTTPQSSGNQNQFIIPKDTLELKLYDIQLLKEMQQLNFNIESIYLDIVTCEQQEEQKKTSQITLLQFSLTLLILFAVSIL